MNADDHGMPRIERKIAILKWLYPRTSVVIRVNPRQKKAYPMGRF